MKKYRVFIILLIITIIYLTINVSSAFVINKSGGAVTAYKNNNLVRLHVIANSNSPHDQYIKRHIRDTVIKKMTDYNDNDTITEEMSRKIEKYVNNVLVEKDIPYSAEVCLGNYNFPMRSYGSLTLPEGEYRAVRIILGSGKGSNWWCVLLPPLCISGEQNKKASSNLEFKFKIAELLADNKSKLLRLKSKLPFAERGSTIDLSGQYIY